MKRFFYATFNFLNFALVAGISFSLRVDDAQNKANVYIYVLDPNSGGAKMYFHYYMSMVDQGFKASTSIYVFGIQRVNLNQTA